MADSNIPRPRRPLLDRFWAKVNKDGPIHPVLGTRCWIWTAATTNGYGVIQRGGVGEGIVQAHRYSYELHNGPLPEGFCALHHCDNPPCVNWDHLFKGTKGDNTRDSMAKGRDGGVSVINRPKTHCPHGHEYTPENTYMRGGSRNCRICHLVASAAHYRRRKGA